MIKRKVVIAVTGASGAIYAKVLLDKLVERPGQDLEVGLIMSDNALQVWQFELQNQNYRNYPFKIYSKTDFNAPFASGSAKYDTMIICPCSMGTLARVASGVSNDLTTRAADVILKERRKLILVTRDTPLSLIHIQNMKLVTQAGAIVCPATPSFYSLPKSFEELAATVVDRVLDLADLEVSSFRWGE
ncbi:UbiX family flavin prenyltransferase [Arcticibacter sp.]|jgi:4-hydroxy-3-polyprenylbenzoate decarboxylase|uniref:UbiX family flavin prenyltransferase n=1 Tax=Arcticibacter sp. TaxID=1872630 RepID=UPI00388D8369